MGRERGREEHRNGRWGVGNNDASLFKHKGKDREKAKPF